MEIRLSLGLSSPMEALACLARPNSGSAWRAGGRFRHFMTMAVVYYRAPGGNLVQAKTKKDKVGDLGIFLQKLLLDGRLEKQEKFKQMVLGTKERLDSGLLCACVWLAQGGEDVVRFICCIHDVQQLVMNVIVAKMGKILPCMEHLCPNKPEKFNILLPYSDIRF